MSLPILQAAVIGWPINHSLSPVLHRYWLEKYRIDGSYDALGIAPDNLENNLASLRGGYCGFNVTAPHKEAMLKLVDTVADSARRLGAVNTVTIANGQLHGMNTDVYGFMKNLRECQPGLNLANGTVVVLGAGGAARAVAAALLEMDAAQIRLINRDRWRAVQLAEDLASSDVIKTFDWEGRHAMLSDAALLVNTTTLGMAAQPALDVNLSTLPQHSVVCDIVYRPLVTPLLAQARAQGLATVDGLGMLLHQAVPAFEAFFGVRPEVTPDLRAHVLESLQA